jgi:hypothetical protein
LKSQDNKISEFKDELNKKLKKITKDVNIMSRIENKIAKMESLDKEVIQLSNELMLKSI